MALSAVGSSRIAGIAPIGLPSPSTWSMNAFSALLIESMPSAVSAPVSRFLLPAVKNAALFRNTVQNTSLIFRPLPRPSLRGTVVIAPRSSLMMSRRSMSRIRP
ncbi:MAG: hypothetical protein BIFFINMI_03834 [Phycisphaerae bacterium]|nr:hypothetical protein [Phycisphaerae bacterium]